VCNGDAVVYTTSAPNTKTIPATTATNGAAINLPTENLWSHGFGAGVSLTPTIGNSTTVTYSIAPEPNPSATNNVSVRRRYITSTNVPVVSPLPAPFTLPTYNINPQACLNNNVNTSVTVFGTSNGGTITGSPTICAGSSTGNMTLSGHRGSVLQWERSFNAGAFVAIAGTGGLTTFSEVPPNGAGTYKYRALVQNQNAGGPCASVTTIVANQNTVTVNPIPTKPTITPSGPTTFCFGSSVTLTSSNVGGLAASYRWYRDGVFTGTTANNIVLNSVAQSGDYTVEVVGVAPSNCTSPASDPTTVTINPLPTAPNPTGGGAVCAGNPAPDIVWTGLTGTPPFNITYTISGVPTGPVVEPTTTFTISNPVTPGVYQMTVLTDANGCSATVLGGSASVTIGGAAPGFDRAVNLIPTITCDNGASTTDPQLDFSLDLASTAAGNYILTYRINGGGNLTKNFTVNLGNGDPSPAITFSEVALNAVATHTIRVVSVQTPAGCLSLLNTDLSFTVRALPSITTQPVAAAICDGGTTSFTVASTGTDRGFQWQEQVGGAGPFNNIADGGVYSGATTATLTLTGAPLAMHSNRYRVVVSAYNPPSTPPICTVTSNAATLTVNAFANITGQPADVTRCSGQNASFTVTATGPGGPLYQWEQDPDGAGPIPFAALANGTVGGVTYAGVTTATLSLTGVTTTLNGSLYRVRTRTTGTCDLYSSNATLTVNPLPTVNNLTPTLCEDQPGGSGVASNIDLAALYDAAVMGGTPPNTSVQYFSNAARTAGFLITTPVNIFNGQTIFTRVTNSATTCINDGTLIFTVRPLPGKANQVVQVCEDNPPGSLVASGINLQTYEVAIAGGSMVNRDVEWYEDITLTTLIPPGAAAGAEQNYSINATKTIHAKVIDTASPTTPPCYSQAQLTLDYQARPNNNQITDGIGQVLGPTYTVCASSNLVLLQINPGLNPGSTYTWTVPPPSYAGEFELLTGTTGFFIILRFPNPIPGAGTLYPTGVPISVKETLGTALCDGNTINTRIIVEGSPPKPIIAGPGSVCSGANGLVYSVTNPVAGSYAWSLPPGATITSLPVTASSITVQMSTFSGNVTVTHASGTGCTSPAADPYGVTVVSRPTITSPASLTICSGTDLAIAHTLTSSIASTTYNWDVINITGFVTGTFLGDAATGVTAISRTLNNTSGVTASVTFRVIPIGPGPDNCQGNPQNFVVTIDPEPVIVGGQSASVCSGDPANYKILLTPAGLPGLTKFQWPAPAMPAGLSGGTANPTAGGEPQANAIHIADALINATNAPLSAVYTITPMNGTCPGAPVDVTIVVNPKPAIPAQTANICSGGTFNITPINGNPTAATIVPAGTTYTWTAPTVTPTAGSLTGAGAQATGQPSISQTLTNTTNVVQTATYTVTPRSGAAGACVGPTFQVMVQVDPRPEIPALSTTICSGGTFNVTPANGNPTAATIVPAGTTYTWTAPTISPTPGSVTGGSAQPVGQISISQTLTNTTNIPQTATYTVTPTSGASGACVGATFQVNVQVDPKPEIPNQAATICSGGTFTVTPVNGNPSAATIVPGGTTYTWTAPTVSPNPGSLTGAGAQPVGQPSISQTLTNTTNVVQTATYTVTPTSGASGACVGATFQVTVQVDPKPEIPAQSQTICSGGTFNIAPANGNPTAATIVPAGTTYTWTAPTVSPTPGSLSGASGQGAAQPSISQTLTNTTNVVQTATYTVTPTSGASGACVGATFQVTVQVDPKPEIPNQSATICSGGTFTISPTNGNPTAATIVPASTTYTWTAPSVLPTPGSLTGAVAQPVGQPSISQTLTNTTNVVQTATYTVTPTSGASGNCVGATFQVTVQVDPKPEIPAQSATICSGGTFTITPTNGNPTAATIVPASTTYTWTMPTVSPTPGSLLGVGAQGAGQPSISQTLTNTTNVVQTATYTVTPTSGASGACVGAAFQVTVQVDPKPEIPAQSTTICSGNTFTITPVNGSPTAATIVPAGTTYTWTAPSISPTPGSLTGAGPQAVGQPSISQTLTNTTNIVQTATYTVTPTSGASGSCVGATFQVTVQVDPKPEIPAQSATICSGGTFTIAPSNGNPTPATIVPGGTTYTWTAPTVSPTPGSLTGASAQPVGQFSISQTLTNTTNVTQTATYTVTPTSGAVGSCVGAAFTVTVTVNPKPEIPAQTATICSGDIFTVTPSNGNPTAATIVPAGTTYTWTAPTISPTAGSLLGATAQGVGQPNISQMLTNTTNIQQTATYTVTPTSGAAGSCVGATFTVSVTVNPKPEIPDQSATICSGSTFTVAPANGNPTAATIVPAGTTYTWPAPTVSPTAGSLLGASAQSAQASISQTLTNTTNVTQTATYTVTPTSGASGSCPGAPFTVTVTVNPKPVIPAQSTTICSGDIFNVTPADGIPTAATIVPAGTTYTWTVPTVSPTAGSLIGASAQGVGQPSISQMLTNTTNVVQTATYTVTPTSGAAGSCVGSTFQVTVTVNPKPEIQNQTTTACSGSPFTVSPANGVPGPSMIVPAGTTYSWGAPAVTGGITGGSAQAGQPNISQTLTNPTNTVQTATYTVTPTSGAAGSCVGATFQVTVTVNPTPVIPNQTATICSGTAFNVSPTNGVPSAATIVPAGTTYSWAAPVVTGGITGGSAQTGQAAISQTLTNPTNSVQTATYTVTPTSGAAGACVGANFQVVVTVNPTPVIPAQTATTCSGSAFTVSPSNGNPTAATIVPAGTTYSWAAPVVTGGITGGSAQTGQANISQTLTNPTNTVQTATYTVTPTSGAAGSCVGANFQVTVTVNPTPVIPDQAATICSGAAFTISPVNAAPVTIVPAGTTYSWAAPVVTGGITGGSAQSGQTNISQTLTNPTNTVQTATYTVTPTSGASGTCVGADFQVTVTVNPTPVIPAQTATICSGTAFTVNPVNAAPTTIVPAGTTYTWTAPAVTGGITGGSAQPVGQPNISQTLTNPTNTVQTATYTVTPTSGAAGSCVGATFQITVTVNPTPVIPDQTATICSGAAFTISPVNAAPTTIVPASTTYTWTAPVVTGGITGGSAQPVGQPIISQTLTNPTNTVQTATYTVTPTSGAAGTCVGATFQITVTVNPTPVIPNQTATICSGTAFTVNPINGNPTAATIVPAATTYSWAAPVVTGGITGGSAQTGQASISQTLTNPTNTTQTATYTVTPTSGAAGACVGATFQVTVTVNPTPVIPAQTATICSGTAFTISPVNAAPTTIVPAGTTYTWTAPVVTGGITGGSAQPVGQPNISQTLTNPTNTPQSATYTVTPTSGAAGSCVGATFQITVTVNPTPVIPAQSATVCSDETFNITPANGGATIVPAGTTYSWPAPVVTGGMTGGSAQTGQPSISQTLTNLSGGLQTATYTVTPTSGAAGACVGASFSVVISVNPEPVAQALSTIERCSGQNINFNIQDIINNVPPFAGGNSVTSKFKYSVVADFPLDVSPAVFPGTFDRVTATNAPINQTFSNLSNHDVKLTFTITPISDPQNCEGTPFVLEVIYHPEPVGSNFSDPVCSTTLNHNIQSQITNPAPGLPSIFTYTVSSDNGGVPAGPDRVVASSAPITDTYTNGTGSPANITYTITPYNAANPTCSGTPFTYTVNVSPNPTGVSGTDPVRCSDEAFTIDPQNYIVPAVTSTFVWTATYDAPMSGPAGGTGMISGSLHNETNGQLFAHYTVTPKAGSCTGAPFTIDLPINPEPVMEPTLATPPAVCSTNASSTTAIGVILNTNGASIAADNYTITLKSIEPGLVALPGNLALPANVLANSPAAGQSNAIANDTYRNTTSAQLKVVYTVVPQSANGCDGNAFDITVSINPEPVLANPGWPNVCSSNTAVNNPVNIVLGTNGTSAAAVNYQLVDRQYSTGGPFAPALPPNFTPNPANAVIMAAPGSINLIKNDRFNNTSAVPVTVRYTIQAFSSQNCVSEPLNYEVTIDPEPTMIPNSATLCSDVASGIIVGPAVGSPVTTQFELKTIAKSGALVAGGSNVGLGTYPANLAAGQSDFLANDVFTNTTAGPLTVTYTIIPIASGCRGVEQTVVFTVDPAPAMATNLNKATCYNSDAEIILATSGASAPVSSFDITNVVFAGGPGDIVQTNGNTGARLAVTANEIRFDRFQNTTNNPLTVTYTVRGNGVAPTFCKGPALDIVLTVEPQIIAAPVNNSASICSSTPTNIDLLSPTTPTSGNITFNYTVTAPPGVTGYVPSLNNLPLGYKITDNLVNNNNNAVIVTYAITPVANGAKNGAGCIGIPVNVNVSVEPKPKLTASPLVQTICESDGVNSSPTNILLTTPTNPSVGSMEFNVISRVATGGAALLSPVKNTYLNGESITDEWSNPTLTDQTVTYTLRPQVNGGLACPGDDVTVNVTIKPRPVISAVANQTLCSGEYRNIPLTMDIAGTFATWTVVAPPTITGALNGGGNSMDLTLFNSGFNVETVTYTVTPKFNNCNGIPITFNVTVNPTPNITGIPATTPTVCNGDVLNIPLGSNVPGTTFDLAVTDVFNLEAPGFFDRTGVTGINQLVNNPTGFQAILIYQITPISPAGCVGIPKILNVNVGSIIPNVTPDQTEICSGGRIQMTNSSLGATSHRWFYRVQGTTTELDVRTTPFVNYQLNNTSTTNPIVYEIVYQPSNGLCTVPDVVTPITVYRNVVAGFNEGTVPPIIAGTSTVNFTNTSNPIDTQFRYEWNFGSASSPATFTGATPPPVVYSQQGQHVVTLKAINIAAETAGKACENTFTKTIFVPILPLVADFTLDPPAACFPATVKVIANPSTGDINEWRVVNSNGVQVAVSGENLPEFFISTPGLFTVQLTTKDSFTGQVEFATKQFEIYSNPVASFQARPTTVFVPDTEMSTFNFSTGANFYSWDFGDGETSDEREPKHIYKIEGVYDIVMVAGFEHDDGVVCTDTLTQKVAAKQGGQTKVPNAFTPNPGGPSGGVTGGGGGGTFNDVFLPIVKGVEEFNMQIFDRWGNLIFESNNANVGWDGYDRNGNILPSGVYVYKLTLRLSDGQRTTQIGDITMIR